MKKQNGQLANNWRKFLGSHYNSQVIFDIAVFNFAPGICLCFYQAALPSCVVVAKYCIVERIFK